jgi:hypothetical protein
MGFNSAFKGLIIVVVVVVVLSIHVHELISIGFEESLNMN